MTIQQLNLRAMIEYARGHGGVTLRYRGLDSQLQALYDSELTRRVLWEGLDGTADENRDAIGAWQKATKLEHWSPYDEEEFVDAVNNQHEWYWWPRGYGTQKRDGINEAKVLPILLLGSPGFWWSRNQSWTDHYQRRLSGRMVHLFDIYPDRTDQDAIDFIRSLYDREINGKEGGWQGMTRPAKPRP